ncbi:MAG: hypothetical protein WA091_00585 [Minisyncoccales bacterium]
MYYYLSTATACCEVVEMDIKKVVIVLVVMNAYSTASLLALPVKGSIAYISIIISSGLLVLFTTIFLIGIAGRFVLDKVREERKLKEFENMFEGFSLRSAVLMVIGALLMLTAFLNLSGPLFFSAFLGMMAFLYGFYCSFSFPYAGLSDDYAS